MSEYDALKQKLTERANRGADLSPGDPIDAAALDAIRTLEERVGELGREVAGLERFRALRLRHNDEMERRTSQLAGSKERNAALKRELAEARKDGERLDWLEVNLELPGPKDGGWDLCRVPGDPTNGFLLQRQLPVFSCPETLRAAIDAAREPEGDGPEELDYPPTPAERLEMADRARRMK